MRILVLPGDGIGEEITAATLGVLEVVDRRFGLGLELEHADIGFAALERTGTTLPDGILDRARECDGVILGRLADRDDATATLDRAADAIAAPATVSERTR